MSENFRVGLTRDFLKPDGTLGFGDISLSLLDVPGIAYEFLAEQTRELRADQVRDYDALIVLTARVTAASLAGAERLALVARFGVGYDSVDVDACTANGVLLTITPDGVRRPVASSVMAFMLALSHQLLPKDRITRAGRWDGRADYVGPAVTGRTLGVIGFGNIGQDVFRLARPFDMRFIAHDPYGSAAAAAALGVELVDLETLLRTADFVSINCALTPETRHLINAERLELMKPTAFLINTARGPIVDQAALTAALRERRIAGAGIDVFEEEPVDPHDPILTLDNVIVTPHALPFTDEIMKGNGRGACESVLAVAAGELPRNIVNRDVTASPVLAAKLRRYREQRE
jgi:phosphoglycerate dehydrogenase-like enzyme